MIIFYFFSFYYCGYCNFLSFLVKCHIFVLFFLLFASIVVIVFAFLSCIVEIVETSYFPITFGDIFCLSWSHHFILFFMFLYIFIILFLSPFYYIQSLFSEGFLGVGRVGIKTLLHYYILLLLKMVGFFEWSLFSLLSEYVSHTFLWRSGLKAGKLRSILK